VRGVAASVSRRSEELSGECIAAAIGGLVVAMVINAIVYPQEPTPYILLGMPAGVLIRLVAYLIPRALTWARRSVGLRG
jgi:hypothetical protein